MCVCRSAFEKYEHHSSRTSHSNYHICRTFLKFITSEFSRKGVGCLMMMLSTSFPFIQKHNKLYQFEYPCLKWQITVLFLLTTLLLVCTLGTLLKFWHKMCTIISFLNTNYEIMFYTCFYLIYEFFPSFSEY